VQPVIAIFEDLHWADSLSLGLLNELVEAAQDARLLLVVSYRPDYSNEWKNRTHYRQLCLDPFVSENLEEFLEALVGSDPSLPTLKNFLVERGSGNPFFVEEMVRRLVDTGVIKGIRGSYRIARPFSETEIPPTVQAVLAARIDALPAADKHLLQQAAVIGHEVPLALLEAICGLPESKLRAMLDRLQSADFLYSKQLFPDLQYRFKHPLTYAVAYSGVLHERRREIHARVVNAMERLYVDRLGEQVERLAHHAVRGELKEKSVHYLLQAARKAAARSALADARAGFEEALDILKSVAPNQPALEQAFDIRVELRAVLRQLGEVRKMLEYLREAETIAERLKDDHRRGRACAIMTTVLSTLDELDEALVTGTRAVEIATRAGDTRLQIVTSSCLEHAYYYRGDYERVVAIATENVAALPTEWSRDFFGLAVPPSVFTRGWLIMSLVELGRFSEAAKYEEQMIRLAESTEHAHTIGWAHLAASMLHLFNGHWAKAHSLVEPWAHRSLDVAVLLPWAVSSSAWTLAQIGDADKALSRVREAEQLLEQQNASGIVGHRSWSYYAASRACLQLGRIEEARRLGVRSLESSHHQDGFRAHALHLLGDLAAHPDQFDTTSGVTHYRAAMLLAKARGMRPFIAHCHRGLGALYRGAGKMQDAQEHLTAANAMYREMDMNLWLEQARSAGTADSAGLRNAQPANSAVNLT
jgi:tetratricopeptide (TPR) repeat protein